MLINTVNRVVIPVDTFRRRAAEAAGMAVVANSVTERKKYRCSCPEPCGNRYFPDAPTFRSVRWSDVAGLISRTLPKAKVKKIKTWVESLRKQNSSLLASGLYGKGSDAVHVDMAGPRIVLTALMHDYPDEFSAAHGAKPEDIEKNLDAVLAPLIVGPRTRGTA